MLKERLAWGGTSIIAAVGIYLAWEQVAAQLPRWSLYAVLGVVALASILVFPYSSGSDGSPQRLIKTLVRGRSNASFVAANGSNTGNVVNTGRGNQTVHLTGAQWTYSDVRQISVDASKAEVLPAARAVASETAIAEIDRRSDAMTDKVLDRINATDPGLYVRWDDPRFLAVLTSAQRSYAETGDENLGDVLASLVAGIASLPIQSRREIILRQAIDVAPRLTPAHLKALAVHMYLTWFNLNQPLDTDVLIRSLRTIFEPYFGGLPTTSIDYSYMSSTGVGTYMEGLQDLGNKPYQWLHKAYPNSMYPAFSFSEMRETLLTDEHVEQNQALVVAVSDDPNAIRQTEQGTAIDPAKVHFRVAPDQVSTVLSNIHGAEQQLSEPQKQLRAMVRERSLNAEQFRDRIGEVEPELANFLNEVERSGALNFQLHPVGIILARHEIGDKAPHLARQIDTALDAI